LKGQLQELLKDSLAELEGTGMTLPGFSPKWTYVKMGLALHRASNIADAIADRIGKQK